VATSERLDGTASGEEPEDRVAESEDERDREVAERTSDENEKKKESEGSNDGPQVGTRYSSAEIHDNVKRQAEEEMDRPVGELAWSGLAAGLLIGFSFLAVAFLRDAFPERLHRVAAAIGYPLGFVFVVLGRHQLFTENTLEPVIPVLHRRTGKALRKLVRLWGIVLPANLVGALLFALVAAYTQVVPADLRPSLDRTAVPVVEGGFLLVFYKGIWAGWLIAGMAWLIASTRDTMAQIAIVFLTTAPIAAFEFRHSIAGAVEAFYAALTGLTSWGTALLGFELPALLGNILGGVVLVALLNHAQAAESSREQEGSEDA
jgi:formate/nitrite transporter FocA (FNT family)